MDKTAKKYIVIALIIGLGLFLLEFLGRIGLDDFIDNYNNKHIKIIASNSTKSMYNSVKDYAKKQSPGRLYERFGFSGIRRI